MLESATSEFGGSRPSHAIEVLELCFPLWMELKRQQKVYEREQIRAALESAMRKYKLEPPEHMKDALETALNNYFGEPPETGDQDQGKDQDQSPRRKRK